MATKREPTARGSSGQSPDASVNYTDSTMATIKKVGLISLLFLAACTKVGPDFEPLAAVTPDDWSAREASITKTDADAVTWWEAFNDPVLNDLVETARAQNLTLQIAGIRVMEARARLGIAVGTQYPQVQEVGGSVKANGISDNAQNADFLDRRFHTGGFGFDTAWELDFWGKFRRGIESSDSALGASIARYDDFLVTLEGDVARTYVLIREFEERIAITERNVAIQQRSFDIADARFRAGAVSELDVRQAEALLNDTRARIPTLETSLRQAKHALSVLLGLPPQNLTSLLGGTGPIPSAATEIAVGIPTDLLRRRPDIRQAELEAASQSARIGIARADLYPSFSLNGFIGLETSHNGGATSNNAVFGDLFDSSSFTWVIGPSVRLPIFNYGRLTNNVRVEDARFQQLVVNYQETVLRAYQEVEDGLVGFVKSQERTGNLGVAVTASRRAVDLSLLQYREGTADYTRVLDTQEFLVDQEDALAVSRSSIALNLISVYKALGGGWQVRGDNEFVPEAIQVEMRERTDWGELMPPEDLQEAPDSGEDVGFIRSLFRRIDW